MPISDDERRTLRDLLQRYHETRDEALLDALFKGHLRLATHVAMRFTNRGVATDDLVQVASLGLLRAIERFEPDLGIAFSTFATPTIAGELKRHFRDKGWAVRVPRRLQELHLRVNQQVTTLTQALGRSPSITELAAATDASEEEVLEAIEAGHAYQIRSLDHSPHTEEAPAEPGHLDEALARSDDRLMVEALLAYLPPREQLMVRMRYYEEMSQSEIAERLGISQMHVSRLLSRSLVQLRGLVDRSD